MTTAVAIKLVAVLLTAALGYGAGRFRLLTHGASDSDAARVLSNAALYVFVPALLFRTTARIDYAHMPWRIIAAYFVPVLAVAFLVYAWHHVRSTVAVAAAMPRSRARRKVRAAVTGNPTHTGSPRLFFVRLERADGTVLLRPGLDKIQSLEDERRQRAAARGQPATGDR